jgi:hypothetical protein
VVVVVVVELLVVVELGQLGRPGSPVQVQSCALHWSVMFFAQLSEGLGPHALLISSLQAVSLSQLPALSAIAEEETKTPTPSATRPAGASLPDNAACAGVHPAGDGGPGRGVV